MRVVNLKFDTEQMQNMILHVGEAEFDRAFSYLSTWNLIYPSVDVVIVDETEMLAVYYEADKRRYVIGAVFNGTNFGFHS